MAEKTRQHKPTSQPDAATPQPAPATDQQRAGAPQTQQARKMVVVDAEVWARIDQILADLPYRTTAPVIEMIRRTGGVLEAVREQPVVDTK